MPARGNIPLVRALDAVLSTPLFFQLVHLSDLLADITASLTHFLGTLFKTQDVACVCSLAERRLSGRCRNADLGGLSLNNRRGCERRRGTKGRVSVVHVAYGWLPDRQRVRCGSGGVVPKYLLYEVGFVDAGSRGSR